MFKRLLSISFLVSIGGMINAQILNVDRQSITIDSSDFFLGTVNFEYNVNNRSTTKENKAVFKGLKSKADLMYISQKNEYIFINQFNYYSSSGSPFISTGYSHFRVNFLRKRIVSYESYAQAQYDKGRNMPLRWLIGSGIRYRVLDRNKNYMHLGLGIIREHERWKSLDDESILITPQLWKVSSYVSSNIQFNEYVRVIFIGYYQSGYDKSIEKLRNRINSSLNLVVKINSFLSLTTNVNYQYEDQPVIPINKTIYSITNGLQLNF